MSLLATVVDGHALWQTAWTAALAGIGVCIVFSLAVVGATRSSESHKANRQAAGLAYAALALAGVAATLGAVVYGVVLLTTK
jgi:hypothetical protein